ncbi:MAG TPA: transcriptional repressor, partial [Ruminococcaceae bacterium]|nr:transcriptional repressor [Oscillospiraceae bacterium]
NLARFKEEGIIISVGTVNGQDRIDGDTKPHAHFICSKCGRVIDVNASVDNKNINEEIDRQYNVKTSYHELTYFGECDRCINN